MDRELEKLFEWSERALERSLAIQKVGAEQSERLSEIQKRHDGHLTEKGWPNKPERLSA